MASNAADDYDPDVERQYRDFVQDLDPHDPRMIQPFRKLFEVSVSLFPEGLVTIYHAVTRLAIADARDRLTTLSTD